MKLLDTIVSLLDPNLADQRKVLKDQDLWQRYLAVEARIAASNIKHRAWRERAEREYLKATGKTFAFRPTIIE